MKRTPSLKGPKTPKTEPTSDAFLDPKGRGNAVAEPVALETRGTTELAEFDFGDAAGAGRETVSASMLKIPFLTLIQKGTKGVGRPDAPPDLKPGNFMNPVTKEIYDGKTGLEFVAVILHHEVVEWIPLDKGGGLVDRHTTDSEAWKAAKAFSKKMGLKFGTYSADDGKGGLGNDMQDTMSALCVFRVPGTTKTFVATLPCKKTAIPPFQNYVSQVAANEKLPNGATAAPGSIPLFCNLGLLTTKWEEGDGFDWYIPVLAAAKGDVAQSVIPIKHPLAAEAHTIYRMYKAGAAKMDYETMDQGGGGKGAGGGDDAEMKF